MAKPLDPATRYATDVVGGRIVASRLVRLACQRHLNDIEAQASSGMRWRPEKAADVHSFFEDVLCLPDVDAEAAEDGDEGDLATGRPFILQPFQKFIVGSLFGWYRQDGQRRFRVAYCETGKGSGKTPLAAGIGLYGLVVDAGRGGQIYAAAVKLDQAKLTFTDAENMVMASPPLRALVDAGRIDHHVNNLSLPETGAFFRPISSEKKGLDGKRVSIGLIDELHEHDTNVVDEKMRAGTKGRPNALIFKITNSGFNRQTVCWHNHEMSRQVLEDVAPNDAWFAFICHMDPCEECFGKGFRQPNPACEKQACDRWDVEGEHWRKANPNLGVSIPWSYLRDQVAEAIGMPSKQNIVRRLNFCEWTESETVWIAADKWKACEATYDLESLRGRECYIGIDLSSKIDLSAVVALFPRPLADDEQPIDLGLSPESGDPDEVVDSRVRHVNFGVDVWPMFWMPRATLAERVTKDKIRYDLWEKSGHLFVTAGSMIDQSVIFRAIEALSKVCLIQAAAFDPSNAGQLATWLIGLLGKEKVFDIQQGFKQLSEPSKVVEALVISERLRHPGNPVLTLCVSNAAKEENSWGDIRPIKTTPVKRIDGMVAMVIGTRVLLLKPPKKRSRYATGGGFIIGAGGVVDGLTGKEMGS